MKLAVILGGTYEMYVSVAKFFTFFEKNTTLKVSQSDRRADVYPSYVAGDVEISFFGCYGVYANKLLARNQEFIRDANKESVMPTADSICAKVKKYDPDIVLFFGICGNIDNTVNVAHFPRIFYELYVENVFPVEFAVPRNRVSIKNIFGYTNENAVSFSVLLNASLFGFGYDEKKWSDNFSKIIGEVKEFNASDKTKQGKELKLLLQLERRWNTVEVERIIEYWRRKKFMNYMGSLREYGSLLDMESWQVALQCNNKPLGIMLYSSDTPAHSLDWGDIRGSIRWSTFNLTCTRLIEGAIKKYS